jgi:DNA-binding NarL/FixJ family response regulator
MRNVLYVTNTEMPFLGADGVQDMALIAAKSPREALQSLAERPMEAVLLDYDSRFAEVSIKQLSRWIKAACPRVYVIMLSNKPLLPSEIPPEADAVLSKRATLELIAATVEYLFRLEAPVPTCAPWQSAASQAD